MRDGYRLSPLLMPFSLDSAEQEEERSQLLHLVSLGHRILFSNPMCYFFSSEDINIHAELFRSSGQIWKCLADASDVMVYFLSSLLLS